jgi:hypothetical protein
VMHYVLPSPPKTCCAWFDRSVSVSVLQLELGRSLASSAISEENERIKLRLFS